MTFSLSRYTHKHAKMTSQIERNPAERFRTVFCHKAHNIKKQAISISKVCNSMKQVMIYRSSVSMPDILKSNMAGHHRGHLTMHRCVKSERRDARFVLGPLFCPLSGLFTYKLCFVGYIQPSTAHLYLVLTSNLR